MTQQDIRDYAEFFGCSLEMARRDLEIESIDPPTDVDAFIDEVN